MTWRIVFQFCGFSRQLLPGILRLKFGGFIVFLRLFLLFFILKGFNIVQLLLFFFLILRASTPFYCTAGSSPIHLKYVLPIYLQKLIILQQFWWNIWSGWYWLCLIFVHICLEKNKPYVMYSLHPWQARFLCGDSDHVRDSVHSIKRSSVTGPVLMRRFRSCSGQCAQYKTFIRDRPGSYAEIQIMFGTVCTV